LKILVEPTGALAAAALLCGKLPPDTRRAGVVLSGGNVDADVLAALVGGGSDKDAEQVLK
jgi:threonine dehydratase